MLNSSRIVDITERCQDGPRSLEKDFDLKLAQGIAQLVKKYDLRFDPHTLVPADDDLADRVWQAALDLFAEFGVYNIDTKRQALFSRHEIEAMLSTVSGRASIGQGKEAVSMVARKIGDARKPAVIGGPAGTPCSEALYSQILQSIAQEPVDALGSGAVATYRGRQVSPGLPLEGLAAKRDAVVAREACRMAGRPGLHIYTVDTAITTYGMLAARAESGLRPSDGCLVAQLPEFKTSWDLLSRIAVLVDTGSHVIDLVNPLIGGIGGGPPGMAILATASHMLGEMVYLPTYHFLSHTHLRYSNNTDRFGIWILALAGQALARNSNIIACNDIFGVSGPGTAELFYEIAASCITAVACGMNVHGVGNTGGLLLNHYTGLEDRFMAEVSRAAVGLSREQANHLALGLVERYESSLDSPNRGKPFDQWYDVERISPRAAYLELYERVKHELAALGLPLK